MTVGCAGTASGCGIRRATLHLCLLCLPDKGFSFVFGPSAERNEPHYHEQPCPQCRPAGPKEIDVVKVLVEPEEKCDYCTKEEINERFEALIDWLAVATGAELNDQKARLEDLRRRFLQP